MSILDFIAVVSLDSPASVPDTHSAEIITRYKITAPACKTERLLL